MPFDPAPQAGAATLPAWLAPVTIDAIAQVVERALADGQPEAWCRQLARDCAWAMHPAMPAAELAEAVAIGLWAARRPSR